MPRRDGHPLRRRERLDRRRGRRDEFLGPGGRTGGGSGPEEPSGREADDEEEREDRGAAGAENLQKPQGRNPGGILPFRIPANADAPAGLDAFSEAAELALEAQEKLVDRPGFDGPLSIVEFPVEVGPRNGLPGVSEQNVEDLVLGRSEIAEQDLDAFLGERGIRSVAGAGGIGRGSAYGRQAGGLLLRPGPENGDGEPAGGQLRAELLRARTVGLHDQKRPRGRSGVAVRFALHRGTGFYHDVKKNDCNIYATNSSLTFGPSRVAEPSVAV